MKIYLRENLFVSYTTLVSRSRFYLERDQKYDQAKST